MEVFSSLRAWVKKRFGDIANRSGYTIIPNWQKDTWQSALHTQKLFRLLSIDYVIDVGANRGQYRDFLRQEVGYKGHILSFEPIPELTDDLKTRARLDGAWTVQACALGECAGSAIFNIMNNTEFSSFNVPLRDSTSLFDGANEVSRRITVKVKTLHDIIRNIQSKGIIHNIYLKLDTQGHDLNVIKGGVDVLHEIKALQTEASMRPIYEGMPRYDEVFRFLEECEFVVSGIFPSNSGHFPILIEFDCFLVNKINLP